MNFNLDKFRCQVSDCLADVKQTLSREFEARLGQGLVWSFSLAIGWGATISSAIAAEQVTLRLGPLEQKIEVEDLDRFAKTGKLPDSLQLISPALTPDVREALNQRLQLDPKLADELIDEWVRSPRGKQLVAALGLAIPDSTIPQLQGAIALAARQANGLTLLGFLRAYPEENITLDLSQLLDLVLQFNPTYLRSSTLGPWLEDELAVDRDISFRSSFDPSRRGTYTVQQRSLTLRDRQRNRTILIDIYFSRRQEEKATREQGGQGFRRERQRSTETFGGRSVESRSRRSPNGGIGENDQLPVTNYQSKIQNPKSKIDSPLVVISPGWDANRRSLADLAEHLASHGLTVAALEHPNSRSSQAHVSSSEFVERPQDVSFVLDELTKLNQQKSWLQGKLNTQQVSAIGHSLGGYTVLALAGAEVNLPKLRQFCKSTSAIAKTPADWLQCTAADLPQRKLQLRDRRIESVIALNPLIGSLFGNTGLSQVETPVLLLASTEDTVTPLLDHQLRPFSQLHAPKYLLTAIGATHLSITDAGNWNKNSNLQERQGEEAKPLRQLLQGVSLTFIKQLTPEAKTYQPFLTSAYAESLSTPSLPLRLNTKLPASITTLIQGEGGESRGI